MLNISKTYLKSIVFIIGLFFLNVSYAQYDIPPKPTKANPDAVYDYAKLLSGGEKASLENKLKRYQDSTSTQIIVAIIESLKGESIGMLTPKWGHKWGVGEKGKDNGVMIVLAVKDRKIWISPGYGAENELTAGIVGQITRNRIIPFFKKGDYYGGLDEGVNSIIEVLNDEFTGERRQSSEGIPSGVVIFLVIFFIILVSILSNNKRNGGGGNHRGRGRTGSNLLDIIILSNLGKGSFGSGSSGGGFSGGFGGGFGGGGFSGGGAGGSW